MNKFEVGDIVVGRVTGITNYGFFVVINNNISGLVHISQISKRYVKNVGRYVKKGDYILAKVISYDNDTLNLSIKDISYKTKKSCINIPKPILKVAENEFNVLANNLDKWINDFNHK